MSDLIRKQELQRLSGAVHRRTLERWLRGNGFSHIYDHDGWPAVDRAHYHAVVSGAYVRPAAPVEPNRAALARLQGGR